MRTPKKRRERKKKEKKRKEAPITDPGCNVLSLTVAEKTGITLYLLLLSKVTCAKDMVRVTAEQGSGRMILQHRK